MTRDPLRRTRRSVLAIGTAAATLLLAGPAAARHQDGHDHGSQGTGTADEGDNRHPSGRDRSVEPGGSGTQGKSRSDPDGATNGGEDKPGGAGGVDLDDQDGNNGCGNDDDFEDDNNGNCGGLRGSTLTPEEAPPEVVGETTTKPVVTPEVLGTKLVRTPPAQVLGVKITRDLPFTGDPLADLAATGLGLLAAGTTTLVVARRRTG